MKVYKWIIESHEYIYIHNHSKGPFTNDVISGVARGESAPGGKIEDILKNLVSGKVF